MSKNNCELEQIEGVRLTPEELLLLHVRNNETSMIRDLIAQNPTLLKHEYDMHHFKTIIQIACSNLSAEVNSQTVEMLIKLGADLSIHSERHKGKQAIHFAATSLNESILKTICGYLNQEEINSTASGDTALLSIIKQCNCESKNALRCIRVLLDFNADPNIADDDNLSPILYSARKGYRKAIALFLEYPNVDIDTHIHRNKTARELIIEKRLYDEFKLPPMVINYSNGSALLSKRFRILKARRQEDFLKIEGIKEVVNESDCGETMLQICARLNLPRCARRLLELGADVNGTTSECMDTPLDIAAGWGYFKVFAELLQSDAVQVKDQLLYKLLFFHEPSTEEINHKKCLKLLLDEESLNLNSLLSQRTPKGNTPLHIASHFADNETASILLNKGASLGNANNSGRFPIEDIEIETLRSHFDNCISCSYVFNSIDLVTFNYRTLLPSGFCTRRVHTTTQDGELDAGDEFLCRELHQIGSEMKVISLIAHNKELRPLLTHPLITSFIHLKWHRISWLFYSNLVLYVAIWLSLTLYILVVYNNPDYKDETTAFKSFAYVLLAILWISLIFSTVKELFQMLISPIKYVNQIENLFEVALIVSMSYILFQPETDDYTKKQVSAIAILASAFQLVLLVGQFPKMSTNIVMLRTVSYSFFKLFLWNAIIILAFAFSFYTLFNDNTRSDKKLFENSTEFTEGNDNFNDPGVSLFKTFVMMTGEFEASNMNFNKYSFTSRILFIVFIFTTVIVMFNLMNGLAVSDTQEIKNNAELFAYKSRIDHICYIENMLTGNIVFLPSKLRPASLNFRIVLPRKLSELTCLFPNYLECLEINVDLNDKGNIRLSGNKKRVRLDGETLKNVRVLLKHRNNLKSTDSLQDTLQVLKNQQNRILENVDSLLERLR